jgi:hypothetical protein
MKRIAPELDGLMWTLAEGGNDRAIDEFGARHPELRSELIHRINMVKGLRSAKSPTVEAPKPIPRFVPREPRVSPIQSKGPTLLVGGLVLAAIAAATFTVITFMTPEKRLHKEDLQIPPIRAQQPANVPSQLPKADVPPVSEPDTIVKGNQSEAFQKPTSLRVDSAPLLTVLDMMSDICGTKIVAAPGMQNPNISVDYEGMTAMDMLRDLGKRYLFTPLDQHDGSILVVPAVDSSGTSQPNDQVGGIRSQKIGG